MVSIFGGDDKDQINLERSASTKNSFVDECNQKIIIQVKDDKSSLDINKQNQDKAIHIKEECNYFSESIDEHSSQEDNEGIFNTYILKCNDLILFSILILFSTIFFFTLNGKSFILDSISLIFSSLVTFQLIYFDKILKIEFRSFYFHIFIRILYVLQILRNEKLKFISTNPILFFPLLSITPCIMLVFKHLFPYFLSEMYVIEFSFILGLVFAKNLLIKLPNALNSFFDFLFSLFWFLFLTIYKIKFFINKKQHQHLNYQFTLFFSLCILIISVYRLFNLSIEKYEIYVLSFLGTVFSVLIRTK